MKLQENFRIDHSLEWIFEARTSASSISYKPDHMLLKIWWHSRCLLQFKSPPCSCNIRKRHTPSTASSPVLLGSSEVRNVDPRAIRGLGPTNDPGTGWTIAPYDWHDLPSKTLFVIGLFRCVVAAICREIQPADERNGRHFSLRILCILWGRGARVNVLPTLWMDKHSRKMPGGGGGGGTSELIKPHVIRHATAGYLESVGFQTRIIERDPNSGPSGLESGVLDQLILHREPTSRLLFLNQSALAFQAQVLIVVFASTGSSAKRCYVCRPSETDIFLQ